MKQYANRTTVIHRTRCATAVAAVVSILAGHAAMAQEATQNTSPDSTAAAQPAAAPAGGQVVVIAGTRQSVASAIDRKLKAGTVSDSIVAEDIGQFPDKNVGEALSRVTGIQLTREFGEGSTVAIRGVEPDLNRIEINGSSVLSTNGGAGRGAELRELASELISSIDVYKGSTADLTEGGVGGTVSIKTRKPLDFKKFTFSSTLSGEKSSIRDGVQPRASLFVADRFLDNRLGLMANVVVDNVHTRNDYLRNTSWTFLRDWDFSPDKTVASIDPAVAAVSTPAACSTSGLTSAQKTACSKQWFDYAPQIPRYGQWQRDHKRSSAELTGQFKFNRQWMGFVSYQANTQDQHLTDRNFLTDFVSVSRLASQGAAPQYDAATGVPTKAGTCIPATTTATPPGMVVQNHYVTQYTAGNCMNVAGQGGNGNFGTQTREYDLKVDSKYTTAGFEYHGDRLQAEGLATKSTSNYDSDSNSIQLQQNAPGLVVNLNEKGIPSFTFPTAYSPENPNSYVSAQIQYRPLAVKNSEDQLKLDFKYRLKLPVFNKVWFGVQSRKAQAEQYGGGGYLASAGKDLVSSADDVYVQAANINQTIMYDPLYTGSAQRAPDLPKNLADINTTRYVNAAQMAAIAQGALIQRSSGQFYGGYSGVSNIPSSWISPSYAAAANNFDLSHFNHGYLFNAPGSDGNMYPQIPAYSTAERILSSYLRLDYATELFGYDFRGNVGGRYTRTRDVSSGMFTNRVMVENSPGSSSGTARVISNTLTSIDNTYNDFLPSVNASLWLVPEQFLVRFGWAKVMARPPIDKLAPNAICTKNSGSTQFGGDGIDDCTAGNPALKPFRAANTDLSLEYYPSQDSQLSAAFFRKNISSGTPVTMTVSGVDLFKDGNKWDVRQPVNAPGAVTNGVELAGRTALTFLPGIFSGFGVDVNYTRMGFKYAPGTERINDLDGSVLPYAGLSKNSYNLGLWYDQGPINARIAYNARDRYYTGGTDVSKNPIFIEKTGYLDAKIQYRYNKNITFSLEGKNLSNQAQVQDAGDLFRINEYIWSGRRYYFSVTIKN